MLTKRIIPCLDCKNGRVVKGVQFENIVDAGSPEVLALRYEQQGADEIVFLDITATISAQEIRLDTVRQVRSALSIPLTVGGGVRTIRDIETLLVNGADKVAINSAGVSNPALIDDAAKRFGSQCIVIAIDAKRNSMSSSNALLPQWQVVTASGTHLTDLQVVDWAVRAAELGAGEILLTSYDRDGTNAGYDLELITAVASAVSIPVIASGGAKTTEDLLTAFNAGADAVLAASMFHFGSTTIQNEKQQLSKQGVLVRV